jgi:tetratricopeptide (TPR) repeat protein
MDLLPILVVIRHSGLSIKELAKMLDVSNEYASKISTMLEREGHLNKVKSGKNVLLFPSMESTITRALLMLENAYSHNPSLKIDSLVHPSGNLRLISILASGPKGLPQILTLLGCSRPTFYRMLDPFSPNQSNVIEIEGKKEKTYGLNEAHPYYGALVDLATALFQEQPVTPDATIEKKVKLTSLRARIILYVSLFLTYRDRPVSTTALTQEGVAQGLWTTQQIVSKELKRLVGMNLLLEKRTHIKDKKRRYKTYHLSDLGIEEYENIKNTLEKTDIKIRDFQRKKRKEMLKDVPELFKSKVTLVEILNHMSKVDLFDCQDFQKNIESRRVEEFISNFQRLAELRYFFGRVKETEKLRDWLENERSNLIMIRGIAGIGKTTFLAKIIQEHRRHWNLFFYTVNEWSTLSNVLTPLANFLHKMKREQLKTLLSKDMEPNIEDVILVMEDSFKDSRALLIFDDVQKADENIKLFFKAMVRSNLPRGVKVVLSGREIPTIYDRRDVFVRGYVQEMELTGLDQTTSEQLLASRGIDESEFEELYKLTEGHPLALELIDKMDGFSNKNLNLFIKEEIVPKLASVEINILRYSSTFRYPFTQEAFFIKEGEKEVLPKEREQQIIEYVENLVENSFLIQSGNTYRIGDIFRDFFYQNMDSSTRERFHSLASKYYQGMDNDPARIETLYHLMSSSRYKDGMGLLERYGRSMLDHGLSEDLRDILQHVDRSLLSKDFKIHLDYYLGEMFFISGDWKQALRSFNSSMRFCKGVKRNRYKTRTLLRAGRILTLQGNWDKGIQKYVEALKIAKKYKQRELESDACSDLGLLYFYNDKIDKTISYEKQARKLRKGSASEVCRTNHLLLSSLNARSIGDHEKAVSLLKKGLKVHRGSENKSQTLVYLNALGEVRLEMEEWKEALDIFDEQIDIATSTGEKFPKGMGLVNSAFCLIKLKDLIEAESRLHEGLHYFKMIKDVQMIDRTEAIFELLKSKKIAVNNE